MFARARIRIAVLFAGLLVFAGALSAAPPGLPVTQPRAEVPLKGPANIVLQQLGEQFGVKVEVDPELGARRLDITLRGVDFADALRVAALLTNAFWVVEPTGQVVVAPDTPEKRQLYTPQVQKTFARLGRSPEELNEAVRLLRDLLDIRRIRPDVRTNSFTVFDTPYRLAVAEELLKQLPDDPGEIRLEVVVLEVDRNRALDLGLVPPDRAIAVHLGAGALVPSDIDDLFDIIRFLIDHNLLPEALTQASLQSLLSSGITDPSQLSTASPPFILFGGGGTRFALNLPGAELRLRQLARVTRGWRRLSLRARAGQEATLFVGDRFPVTFTTFSSIFIPEVLQELIRRGLFQPAVPAVRYEDLGAKIVVNPRLHPGREVTLDLRIEQLALSGQEINGIPVLVNREIDQQVRLKAGESMLVAGMRRSEEVKRRSGWPVLGRIPVLGRLFSHTSPTTQTTEFLLVVTPRLMRLPPPDLLTARSLYLGTEKDFAPIGPQPTAEPPAPPPQQPRPQQPPPTQPQPPQPQPQPPQQQPPPPQPQPEPPR
ncbi:MAG: hypothetical protein ACRD35_05920 [Candidatus Acidiferrales bacterium]